MAAGGLRPALKIKAQIIMKDKKCAHTPSHAAVYL